MRNACHTVKRIIRTYLYHFQKARLSASAAELAYYTLLSIFPAILIVGNILPMVGLDAKTVLSYLETAIPTSVYNLISPVIYDLLHRGSGGLLTTGVVIAIWSTSQAIAAFQRDVNAAYGVAEDLNPIWNRIVSFLWILVVLVVIATLVFLYGLGEPILRNLQPILNFNTRYIHQFASYRYPVTFIGLFVGLLCLYYFVPNARVRLRFVALGSLVATFLLMGLARLLTYYGVLFNTQIASYKTISAFIVMMIWLDLSGIIVMIGATINATTQVLVEGKVQQRRYLWDFIKDKSNPDQPE